MTNTSGTGNISEIINSTNTTPTTVNFSVMPTANGCSALTATLYPVTVNPLPVPTITGQTPVCENTSFTYSTEAAMSGYLWNVPPNGTITAGAGTNAITVHWTTAGTPAITINYTNAFGCTAVSPSSKTILVNPAPVPTITGLDAVCRNSTSSYSTQTGMSAYLWTVSGGTIVSGTGTNSVQITWNTAGSQTITASFTDPNGCVPLAATSKTVQVNSLPTPLVSGSTDVCANQSAVVYSTPPLPNHDYIWTVTGALSFTGDHTSSISVNWGSGPLGTVQVNEYDQSQPTNCNTLSSVFNVAIHPNPSPVISGPAAPCGQTTQTYTIGSPQANHAYQWTVTGGTPASGTASGITVTWGNTNPVSITMQESITYAPGVVCTSAAPTFPIALVLIPDAAGTISGPSNVCQGWTRTFTVSPINNADSYTWWYIPSTGATITNSGPSASIIFDLTASSGNLYVKGNKTGCASGPDSPPFPVGVHGAPFVALQACNYSVTTTTSRPFTLKGGTPLGGQYLVDGNPVSGGIFDPSALSTTTHQVTYTFSDFHTCVNTSSPILISVVSGSVLTNCPTSFTDPRDNKTYRSLSLGSRCWMVDNLSYGNILSPTDQPQRDNCTPEKYCLPSDPSCTSFGGFYQWDELMQYQVPAPGQLIQGLCPPEWHVPTAAEWQLLIDGVTNAGNGLAGSELKDQTPTFGFKALLSGVYYQNSAWMFDAGNLTAALFWSSSPSGATRAISRGLNSYEPSVSRYHAAKSNALPVRCVKD